jgi:hypothetical protein
VDKYTYLCTLWLLKSPIKLTNTLRHQRTIAEINQPLDNGRSCVGVFLDLGKAFDTVSVPILLKKLEAYGIRGTALECFARYLSGRRQCVRIGDNYSSMNPIPFGVPQGSILRPTRFIIYLNDLCSISAQNAEIICYADDTALFFGNASWELVRHRAEIGMGLRQKHPNLKY